MVSQKNETEGLVRSSNFTSGHINKSLEQGLIPVYSRSPTASQGLPGGQLTGEETKAWFMGGFTRRTDSPQRWMVPARQPLSGASRRDSGERESLPGGRASVRAPEGVRRGLGELGESCSRSHLTSIDTSPDGRIFQAFMKHQDRPHAGP